MVSCFFFCLKEDGTLFFEEVKQKDGFVRFWLFTCYFLGLANFFRGFVLKINIGSVFWICLYVFFGFACDYG